MPVTLAQASLNAADAGERTVIDEFRKNSAWLLDRMPIDDAVAPAGGGATLTYGYMRQITQRAAAFRAINSEYTPAEATKQRFTVDLKPLGGSYQIDRVLSYIGSAAVNEVAFQERELIKASTTFFADQVINGDSGVDANGFDGLSAALAGTATEYNAGGTILDLTAIDTKAEALAAVRRVNAWLGLMDGPPDAIFGNKDALAWFYTMAAWADQLNDTTDAFGVPIQTYRNIPLVDLGEKAGSNNPILGTYTEDADTGLADLFAVRFGLDGFHLVAVTGPLVRTWLPDFSTAGAVKTGETELGPVAPVLKRSKAAAVFRRVKVA